MLMKPKLTLLFALIISCLMTLGQRSAIELTFTAVNNTTYVQLDSIKIMNRTQGGETMIYWPDTTISLEITPGDLLLYIGHATLSPFGVQEISQDIEQFKLFPNFPNPVYDQSTVSMWIPETGVLNVMVMDVQGRIILTDDWQLDRGHHFFRFIPGDGTLYFLTASWNGVVQSIKILTTEHQGGQRCMFDYKGSVQGENVLKVSLQANNLISQESGILDTPLEDQSYTFQFATNIPCPGTPTVENEGQVYNTIQVFSQCWLKENLNVGTKINSTQSGFQQTNNGIIEKYCYNNDEANCDIYGGLYEWTEAMQYVTYEGAQGICPAGWHIATDNEWKILEGTVDSQYGIGDPVWDQDGFRGYDVGGNLKESDTTHWISPNTGATNSSGFTGLPGSCRSLSGSFFALGYGGVFWSSSQIGTGNAWLRDLGYLYAVVGRYGYYKEAGYSVRCLKD